MKRRSKVLPSRILLTKFVVAIIALAQMSGCGQDKRAETPGAPTTHLTQTFVARSRIEALDGARPNLEYYREIVSSLETTTLALTANDYERLWETAYAYRDRIGAKKIAVAIKGSGSRFWYDCFLTLADGQELARATTAHFQPADLPKGNQTVFVLLFPYKDLNESNILSLQTIASLLQKCHEKCYEEGSTERATGALTGEDKYRIMREEVSTATSRGDYVSADEARRFEALNRLASAVLMAFKSCHYESGAKWLKEWLAANDNGGTLTINGTTGTILPMLFYYSGESIYLQEERQESKWKLLMLTSSGIKLGLIRNRQALSEEDDFFLRLSQERDQLPWIGMNADPKERGAHLNGNGARLNGAITVP